MNRALPEECSIARNLLTAEIALPWANGLLRFNSSVPKSVQFLDAAPGKRGVVPNSVFDGDDEANTPITAEEREALLP